MNSDTARIFFEQWQTGEQEFTLTTSGSTGEPKTIALQKDHMQWSAANTASVVRPTSEDSLLCCLPCTKVGGLMMLVRSLEWRIPVEIIEPIANPYIITHSATIVSITPYQLYHILDSDASSNNLKTARMVIIGGGELSDSLEKKILEKAFDHTIFYHSYGMTETYSHIALRAINGENASAYFTPFADVKVYSDENNCAVIQLPFPGPDLYTTDIIHLNQNGTFEILGRADYMINTGGVKIQPELIEKAIRQELNPKNPFIISSEKDEVLGNKIILIAEKEFEYSIEDLQFLKSINPYAVPKRILITEAFQRNEGDKIIRPRL